MGVGRRLAAVGAAALMLGTVASADAAPQLVPYGTFTSPIFVTAPPADSSRVFVVERAGRIQVISNGQKKLFLDISATVDSSTGERGLLSMAFALDYATSGLFYVFDTDKSAGNVKIEEFQRSAADPDVADPASRRVVMNEAHSASNHNGGQLQFGPDGYLYATVGDNATSSNAQTLSNVYGKILRIDPRAGHTLIPADNPFVGSGGRGEIWALGLRNPWRFSFDRSSGDLIIGDVGQSTTEEINLAPRASGGGKGLNFGWPNCEGPCAPTNAAYTDPVYSYDHSSGDCAITGGYVVRADDLPSLAGRYVFGDYCTSVLRSIVLAPGSSSGERSEGLSTGAAMSLVSFGEDSCGHVYVISDDGPVSRLSESSPAPACPADTPTPTPTPAPTATPPPAATPPPPDKTPPHVAVRVHHRQRSLRSRTLEVTVACNEPCSLIVSAHVSGPRGLSRPKARVRAGLSAARRTITLHFTRRGIARIRRALKAHRTVRAVVRVAAIDAAGNWGIGRQNVVRIVG